MRTFIDLMIHKKILIADDDPAIVDSLRLMLELAQYQVSSTIDGHVLSMMKNELPDLVILDIWMSGVDGRDICRELKNSAETKNIPVIMISASRDIKKSTKESGADDFLEKPFEMNDLLEKVERHIN